MAGQSLGVCYYPEHWPEEIWEEDAARMREAGIEWVRIGEFAWSRLEPAYGDLQFDWLDRAVEILSQAGLKIVLGTPTATPPRWMLDRHPDMLALDEQGRERGFGSRRHYCFSHQGYREECRRIVTLLAERYGQHPAILAWQTDNEYGCHDTTISYSDAARQGFRQWLAEKYTDIDTLNQAWGNIFWSMDYTGFDEIGLPNLTVTEANPSHRLDFARYSSDQVVTFNKLQVDILRAHIPDDRALIHNYMGRIVEFDHFKVGQDLDVASWDSYPLGFLEDRSDEGEDWKRSFARQGDPDFPAFHHDLYRAVGRGRWWVMEQQPGPVNWAPYNPAPLDGMVRLWSLEAFAHGAEVVSYFRWRQAPFAQEQMHAGLLAPDSAPAQGMIEAQQVAEDLKSLGEISIGQDDVALIFDYEAALAWKIQPQGAAFDYFRLVFDFYRGLRRLGLSVDILPPDCADLSGYNLVVSPGILHWREELLKALQTFEGQILIGPRSGSKTTDFAIPEGMPPGLPKDFCDLRIARVESLRPDMPMDLKGGGAFQIWFEQAEPGSNMNVLMETSSGAPALMQQDNLFYLAGWPDAEAMPVILGQLAAKAGLTTESLPDGLRIRKAGDLTFLFNYGLDRQNIHDFLDQGELILGQEKLDAAGVAVFRTH